MEPRAQLRHFFSYLALAIALNACGNEPPPKLPETPQKNDQIISGNGSTVSADQSAQASNAFASQNIGADIGSDDEKAKAKECIDAGKRYDRTTKECDDSHKPIHSYAWTLDGIVGGLGLSGQSETDFRAYFAAEGQFAGFVVDQVTSGPDGKTWIWIVKDSGAFVITNHLTIGS